jgi:hypothetical protein
MRKGIRRSRRNAPVIVEELGQAVAHIVEERVSKEFRGAFVTEIVPIGGLLRPGIIRLNEIRILRQVKSSIPNPRLRIMNGKVVRVSDVVPEIAVGW